MTCSKRLPNRLTNCKQGYITVFLTIAVSVSMALIIGMFYGIRDNAIRMKCILAVNTAITSSYGEYNRELWERYNLIFVDSSYMSSAVGMKLPEEHLERTLNRNFEECDLGLLGGKDLLKLECSEAETRAVCLATDEKGAAIRAQAVNLMKYHYKIAYVDEVSNWLRIIREYGLAGGASYEEAYNAAAELNERFGVDYSCWLPSVTAGNDLSEDPGKGFGILYRVTDASSLSNVKINNKIYASHRKLNKGNLDSGYEPGITDYFFLREYALNKCGCFLDVKDESVLDYQVEYLVAGKESDRKNLASVVKRIMVIREAANMKTLNSDEERMTAINLFCWAICTLLGIPEAEDLLKVIVVACWANFESISDVRILLEGGKIPLIKEPDEWISGLRTALFGEGDVGKYDEGLSYEDYLRIFMYLTGEEKLTSRLEDLIEMDVRSTEGNECFRLDNCFDDWEVEILVHSDHGYDYRMVRRKAAAR